MPAEKVEVVYNAIDFNGNAPAVTAAAIDRNEKLVLFLGRITMQKGPEYFLRAAKKVLEVMDNVRFIMAGSGDMIRGIIEMAAGMGIGHKVLFTGFLRGPDVERVFRMADLYVMPSVSEPFGIAPLEAMSNDVPVIISKQSGVSEVLTHALKVDFWDVNEMANKIIAVLRHPPLQSTLRQHGRIEVQKLSWTDSAKRCVEIYSRPRLVSPTESVRLRRPPWGHVFRDASRSINKPGGQVAYFAYLNIGLARPMLPGSVSLPRRTGATPHKELAMAPRLN